MGNKQQYYYKICCCFTENYPLFILNNQYTSGFTQAGIGSPLMAAIIF